MAQQHKTNYQIEAEQIDLVLLDGTMKRSVFFEEALAIAEDNNLDLVEISSQKEGQLSICKMLDYGKMMYQQNKKKKANKKVQHIKEIKYGFNISDHDLEVKHRKILDFLSKHYTIRYVLELRGREKYMADEALQKMKENLIKFEGLATWKEPYISGGGKKVEISTVLHVK